jgi:hypothetical protein
MVLNEHRGYIDHEDRILLNDTQDYKRMMEKFLNNQFDADFLIFDF